VPEASFSKAWHLETRLVFQRRKSKWTKITWKNAHHPCP
jgi:hypothetical protein